MTHEEWRNLKKGDLIIAPGYLNLFVVKSIGWDDIEEKDYKDESDYIIEVTELFEHLETPHNGGTIFTAQNCRIFNEKISSKLLNVAVDMDSPTEYLLGYINGRNLLYEDTK